MRARVEFRFDARAKDSLSEFTRAPPGNAAGASLARWLGDSLLLVPRFTLGAALNLIAWSLKYLPESVLKGVVRSSISRI